MCGIAGYIGKDFALQSLIKCLKILEYRGYDSAGMAVGNEKEFEIIKSVGNISNLERKINFEKKYSFGIGHTRWATNGKVNVENCHPHESFDGEWIVVHNGIIENATYLKEKFLNGVKLSSETDTELIAHLIASQKGSYLEKISKALKLLSGSWALAIINKNQRNKIYLAKNKSPLFYSLKKDIFVSSDPICFPEGEYYSLKNGQIAELSFDEINVYDSFLNKSKPKVYKGNIVDFNVEKHDAHFMLKEIKETKLSLKRLCEQYSSGRIFADITKNFLNNIEKVEIIGCGTAFNSALIGAKYLERVLKKNCNAYVASEYRYKSPLIDEKSLCIFVSQSGETADTLECMRLAKAQKAKIISMTNVSYSTIAKESKIVFPICAGREIAVASTKAYTCQLGVFYLLSLWIKSQIYQNRKMYLQALRDIKKVSNNIDIFDLKQIDEIAKKISHENSVFFLGRGIDYFTSLEASLKLKEITYINSSAYPSGELKHGYIALIEKGTKVFVFATSKRLFDKTLNGINEIASRGAVVYLITSEKPLENDLRKIDSLISIQRTGIKRNLYPLISILFAQYLAYFTSVSKGYNPDQPRNLAKSVTVE